MKADYTGTRLGGYEVGRQIGSGATASVYQARELATGRDVAIKILQAHLTDQPGFQERFASESRFGKGFEHPAILPVFDVGDAEGVPFIAMAYLPAGSLADRIRGQPALSFGAQLAILERIASGLDHAHGQGVIHRDLKPENVLFDADGNAYLADFGVARHTTLHALRMTAENAIVGTPTYLSPEQITGEPVGPGADLYAFGVIAYEMLAGAPPFTGTSVMALMLAHVEAEPPRRKLSAGVYDVLSRMMSKRPEDRYASAQEFVRALRAASGPMAPEPVPPPGAQPRKPDAFTRERPSMPLPGPSSGATVLGRIRELATTWWESRTLRTPVEVPARATAARYTIHRLATGDTLGSYRLERRLDNGDRTRVYEALDVRRERHVAIKVIGTQDAEGEQAARFRREAQLLGRLHHAHIVPFFDYDSVDGISYIVMPLLPGRSLETRITREGRLALPFVTALVEQIAGALDYLHGENIIHRDLKPNNLVFDEHDNIYLADLGIAKILNDAENVALTMVGQAIGTPYYMPPEQWLGGQITPATDQYALGCIVYRLLTGELPFQGETTYTMMLRHVRDDPPTLSSRRQDLPNSLDAVLARALAKESSDRFPSAGAFSEAFQHAAQYEHEASAQLRGSGHVFISYSRADGDYAYRLADRIRAAGCDVWIDSRLEPADSWWRVIVDAVEGCAAFVSIMSPTALESKWVEREILLADRHNKPAFPLLLGGEPFPIYVGTQYLDVRAGTLPPDPFFSRLAQVVGKRDPAARATPEDSVA